MFLGACTGSTYSPHMEREIMIPPHHWSQNICKARASPKGAPLFPFLFIALIRRAIGRKASIPASTIVEIFFGLLLTRANHAIIVPALATIIKITPPPRRGSQLSAFLFGLRLSKSLCFCRLWSGSETGSGWIIMAGLIPPPHLPP